MYNQNNTNNYLQYSSLYSTACMPIISYVYVVHIIVYRSRIFFCLYFCNTNFELDRYYYYNIIQQQQHR